jgi:hypothetical protein
MPIYNFYLNKNSVFNLKLKVVSALKQRKKEESANKSEVHIIDITVTTSMLMAAD